MVKQNRAGQGLERLLFLEKLHRQCLLAAAIIILLPALTGCGLLSFGRSQPKAQVISFRTDTNGTRSITISALQLKVMRFADMYAAEVAQAADDFQSKVGTPEARLEGLKWKLGQATSSFIDGSGQNPVLSTLDLLVLVTISRMVVEDHFVKTYGDAALPLLRAHRELEAEAWSLAGPVLKPDQQTELRELIAEWREKNPGQRFVGFVRFREFVTALGKMPEPAKTAPTSIFSLLFLDPMAGLDPTAAAIQETRLLGERAMYYTQRMPVLLSWQTEVLVYQLAAQPESKQILADAERFSGAAESFAKTAGQLPQLVNDQREAAIKQVLAGLSAEGFNASNLLAETRQTLKAAEVTSASVHDAIKSLDAFVRYVLPPTNSTAVTTNSKPFDVLDYGRAAGEIGAAAKNLDALLISVNQSTPAVERLTRQTSADAERVIRQAFWFGLTLGLCLLTGAVLAGLAYRTFAHRLTRTQKTNTDTNRPS